MKSDYLNPYYTHIFKLAYKNFNAQAATHFMNAIPRITKGGDKKVLVLDFSNVNTLDLKAIDALKITWVECKKNDVRLIICNTNMTCLSMIRAKFVDYLVETTRNLEQALEIAQKMIERKVKYEKAIEQQDYNKPIIQKAKLYSFKLKQTKLLKVS